MTLRKFKIPFTIIRRDVLQDQKKLQLQLNEQREVNEKLFAIAKRAIVMQLIAGFACASLLFLTIYLAIRLLRERKEK